MGLRIVFVFTDVGIGVLDLIKIAEGVVDLPVLALIGANIQKKVAHSATSFRHFPVVNRNLGNLKLLPLRQSAGINILDLARVRDDGLFLEISYKSMYGARTNEVREEQGVAPDTLSAEHYR